MPTGQQYSSVATQALLTGGISSANTTCNVSTTSGFPAAPFTGVLDIGTASQEIVDVTVVSSLTLTITRGVDGSAAQAHSTGATFTHSAIARDLREARSHMDTGTASSGTPIHGLVNGSSVVGTTDTQTLSNKTLSSPTINSPTINNLTAANPTITGTVAGAADFVGISLDGTIGGTATLTGTTLNSPTLKNTAIGSSPAVVNGITGTTADLVNVQVNSVSVFEVLSDGALKIDNNGTTNPGATVNTPTGSTADILDLKQNGTLVAAVDHNGQLLLTPGPLSIGGITGAATTSRYVGATSGGPPTTGTFVAGDYVVDKLWGIHWTCTVGGTPGTWSTGGEVLLQEVVLSVSGTVTLNAGGTIPGYFRHLKIRGSGSSNDTGGNGFAAIEIQFNGDVAADYSYGDISITNSNTVSGFQTNGQTFGVVGSVPNGGGNIVGGALISSVEVSIPYYSLAGASKSWVFQSHASSGQGAPNNVNMITGGGMWGNNNGAITSVKLLPAITPFTFAPGTRFTLHAIA